MRKVPWKIYGSYSIMGKNKQTFFWFVNNSEYHHREMGPWCVFLIGLLLGQNSVLIRGVYVWVVSSHVFCLDAIGWSEIFHEDSELKRFHILWKDLKLQKNLHFCRWFFLTFSNMEIFFPFGYPTTMFTFQLWQKLRENDFRGSWNGKKISISNIKHFQLCKWIIVAIASFAIIEEKSSELI